MKIAFANNIPSQAKGVLVFVYAGDIKKQLQELPIPAGIRRQVVLASKHITGNAVSSFIVPLSSGGKDACVVVGLGKKSTLRQSQLERAVRLGVKMLRMLKQKQVAIVLPGWRRADEEAYLVTANVSLANYVYAPYKKSEEILLQSVTLVTKKSDVPETDIRKHITSARIIGEEVNKARDLSNTPGGDMTPTLLAQKAQNTGKESGFRVTVYDEKKMKTLGMGGILGVSRGSVEEARLILAEYKPQKPTNKRPIVLVGKGVTFDTGGLNIKPDMNMLDMHLDMSGGASVLHALAAVSRLKLPVHVVAIVPAVENMPSGSGYRPGDILKTYSGKTIEVKHTDAEGRIILADALSYAKKYNPEIVIDVATLTGAALVALGQRTAGIMCDDETLQLELVRAGEQTGDRVWPLPLWEDYKPEIKGSFGDVANLGKTKFGGTITAGVFLWEFAPIKKWAHIDIAPTMVSIDDDQLAAGSKGAGVQLLTRFVQHYAENHKEE